MAEPWAELGAELGAGASAGIHVGGAVQQVSVALRAAAVEQPETDARWLVATATHLSRAGLISQSDRLLTADEQYRLAGYVNLRLARMPVARILGEREFYGRPFHVTPAVLDPRADSETLIDAALDVLDQYGGRQLPWRFLDIGTGSGCLLATLLSECPLASGVGIDISPEALQVAAANTDRLGVSPRCSMQLADLHALEALVAREPFDLIISNPPYIASGLIPTLAPEVREYDPLLALDGGADGLDAYRAILAAMRYSPATGWLIMELGWDQASPVSDLAHAAGLTQIIIKPDLAGVTRALLGRFGE